MAKCTPTAWSDPNFHLPPSSPIRSLSSGNQLSFPPPPTSVLAHQRREKPRCWSKIFFNEIYLLIHTYIYILRVSIHLVRILNQSFLSRTSIRGSIRISSSSFLSLRCCLANRVSRKENERGDIKELIDRQSSNSGTKKSAADKGERRW